MQHQIDSFPGREIVINGKRKLYFGGTSYLGLQTDAQFKRIFIKNIEKFGTNYGASRKSNVQLSIYSEVEKHLATQVGSEACVTLSSGYLAGQLLAQTMNSKAYSLFYAPDTHAAIHIPNSQTYATYKSLNLAVREHLKKEKSTPVVLLDTVDTKGLNYPDFKALQELPLQDIILVADDSHGIGIIGIEGSGAFVKLKALKPKELLVCCSLGKGFGVQAGAIFGKQERIIQLMNTSFFGGASPATPAALATLVEAECIFSKKRKVLQRNIAFFISGLLIENGFLYINNHPAFTFSNTKLSSQLEDSNIIISNFNYPNEDSPLLSRIVLSANHKKEDIQQLLRCLNTL